MNCTTESVKAEPPLDDGAEHETFIPSVPEKTERLNGADGLPGVILSETVEYELVPAEFIAATLK